MAHKYLSANLPRLLREAGLTVVEVDGWRTRGRPESTGGFAPTGVLWHHTGAYDSLSDAKDDVEYAAWLAKVGRVDLPPPLCQLSISAEGTVFVTAAGRANHAGDARASGPMPSGDGNALYVGVECMNSGKQGWGRPQYDAMVTTGTVLSRLLDCSASHHRGHKETSISGKWDPGMLNMEKFRADIRRSLAPPKPTRVERAHDKADEILKDFRALSLKLNDLEALLDKVPEGRHRVASWRAQLVGVSTGLDRLRVDLRKSIKEAPKE